MPEHILVIDDETSMQKALRIILEEMYTVSIAKNGADSLRQLNSRPPDLILLDIGLPDINGLELLKQIRKKTPDAMVIMITAIEKMQTVVQAVKLGAHDYLVKPVDGQELKLSIQNAMETRRLKDRIRRIQQPKVEKYRTEMIGKNPQVKSLLSLARKVARSPETPILIMGESGVGKGVLSRTIHYAYSESPGPFVTVNCTAITHELFESELFGYEQGAFTGARTSGKTGRFEEAADGTILLDEIGAMTLRTQAKLLGVLEDRSFYRVGGAAPIPLSARIIAATNTDIERAAAKGLFREDLYFRLSVVAVRILPLRERPEDILLLAEHFMDQYNQKFGKKFKHISQEVQRIFLEYAWPGNVRELRNTIERITLLEEGDTILPEHLSLLQKADMTISGSHFSPGTRQMSLDYEAAIKALIRKALRQAQGNVLEAARLLNMPPHKLRYRIKKYGLT